MATLFQNDEDNQQNSQQEQSQGPMSLQGSSGSNAPSTGVGVSAPAQTGPFSQNKVNNNPASNLKKYREANQTDVSGKLASTATKEADAAQSKFQNIRNTFNQGQGQIQDRLQQGQQFASQIPTGQFENIVQDQNKFKTFEGIRDADTSDINTLQTQLQQGQQQLNPQLQRAQQAANQFGTEEGRFGLLKSTFGKSNPSYNIGQQRLDQLLVQGDPNLRQLETGLKSNVGNIQRGVQGLESQVNEFIPGAQTQLQDLSGNITSGIRNYENDMQNRLTDLAKTRSSGDDQRLKEVQARYNSKALGLDDLKFLGIDAQNVPGMITGDWNNLSQYLDKTGNYTAQQVATQGDQAKLNALKQLAGQQIASEFDFNLDQVGGGPEDRYNLRSVDPFTAAYEAFKPTNETFQAAIDSASIDRTGKPLGSGLYSRDYRDDRRRADNNRYWGADIKGNYDYADLQNYVTNWAKGREGAIAPGQQTIDLLNDALQRLRQQRTDKSLYSYLSPEARSEVMLPKQYGIANPSSGGTGKMR